MAVSMCARPPLAFFMVDTIGWDISSVVLKFMTVAPGLPVFEPLAPKKTFSETLTSAILVGVFKLLVSTPLTFEEGHNIVLKLPDVLNSTASAGKRST